jgi:exosome complex component RRP4
MSSIVTPGDVVTREQGYLKGKGVYEREGELLASLCGVVQNVNKLVFVKPARHRYLAEVGDVVCGRILEVGTDRWTVEVGSAQTANLMLASIILPGNVQRMKTDYDAMRMRDFYKEGDIMNAEVQKVGMNGQAVLHTRSARYGKLQNGVKVAVSSALVPRQAAHIVNLDCGVNVVLGRNGWIWIGAIPPATASIDNLNYSQAGESKYLLVDPETREKITRVRNVVVALGNAFIQVTPPGIMAAYEASVAAGLSAKDLLQAEGAEVAIQPVREMK